jgi:hypothetical protein
MIMEKSALVHTIRCVDRPARLLDRQDPPSAGLCRLPFTWVACLVNVDPAVSNQEPSMKRILLALATSAILTALASAPPLRAAEPPPLRAATAAPRDPFAPSSLMRALVRPPAPDAPAPDAVPATLLAPPLPTLEGVLVTGQSVIACFRAGRSFVPVELGERFQIDGRSYRFTRYADEAATLHDPAGIAHILRIEPSTAPPPAPAPPPLGAAAGPESQLD